MIAVHGDDVRAYADAHSEQAALVVHGLCLYQGRDAGVLVSNLQMKHLIDRALSLVH